MKTKDILAVCSIAAITATLTLAAFWPASLDALDQPDAPSPENAQPVLTVNGVQLRLVSTQDATCEPLDPPTFSLSADNTTDEPVTVTVQIQITSLSLAQQFSRMGPMPQSLWGQKLDISLEGKEKKIVSLPTNVKLSASSQISVYLSQGPPEAKVTSSPSQPNGRRAFAPIGGVLALTFTTPKEQVPATVAAK